MLEEREFPEIPGELMPENITFELKQTVGRLLGRRKLEFPGSQPVSFANSHIQQNLESRDYFVCEKSDGLRCLMLCILDPAGEEAIFLITRENQYFRIPNLHIPLPEDENSCHNGTLIDGELVLSKRPIDDVKELRYLMFDCLAMNGKNIVTRPLDKRLGYLSEQFYKPYFKLRENHPKECENFPFKLSMKNMHLSYKLPKVFESLKFLGHTSDGLIFTCCETPYVFGTDPTLLKWKPSEENTIDFKLHLDIPIFTDEDLDERDPYRSYPNYDTKPGFELQVWEGQTSYSPFSSLEVSDEEWEKLKNLEEPLEERIVECNKDTEDNWKLLRFRDDKSNGNHISIVHKVLQSIKDAVTKEELIEWAPRFENAWKARSAKKRSHQQHQGHHPSQQQQQPSHPHPHQPPQPLQQQEIISKQQLPNGKRQQEDELPSYEDDSDDEPDSKKPKME